MAVFKEKAAIVINGIVYVAEPMDDCEDCAFCTGLAQCSVDFICISMREASARGLETSPSVSKNGKVMKGSETFKKVIKAYLDKRAQRMSCSQRITPSLARISMIAATLLSQRSRNPEDRG